MHFLIISERNKITPATAICFWCQQPTNVIVLFGRLGTRTSESPAYGPVGYEPCKACKEIMTENVMLVEFCESPQHVGQYEIQPNIYPTGRHTWITVQQTELLFGESGAKQILEKHMAFFQHETYERLINPASD